MVRSASPPVLIVLVVVLIAVGGIAAIELGTPQQKSTSTLRLGVERVSLDKVDAETGHSIYILLLNVSNPTSAPWHFNPSLLQLDSNASQVYSPDGNYSVVSVLGVNTVGAGGHLIGNVAFELSSGQVPSSLHYLDTSSGINLTLGNLPQESAVALLLDNVQLRVNGGLVDGWVVTNVSQATSWVHSIICNPKVTNNTFVFFTGQAVQVSLAFEYLRKPTDPNAISLVSVSDVGVFPLISSSPGLPISMNGWASEANLEVLLKVPSGVQSGTLAVSVEFAG